MACHRLFAFGCGLLVVGMAGGAAAGEGKEFPLKYRLSVTVAEEVGTSGQTLTILGDPPRLKSEPRYASPRPLYSVLSLGAGPEEFHLVLDSSERRDRGYDTLYVDADRDGRITVDEKVVGQPTDTGFIFGPVRLLVWDGARRTPQWFQFRFSDYEVEEGRTVRNFQAFNAGYYTGTVQFGDQKRRIALVDSNGNGVYNDYPKPGGPAGDRLLIDLNGDGQFDIGPLSEEAQPLGRYVLAGDRYWRLDVAPDGSAVTVAPLDLPLGTLRSEVSEFALLLRGREGDLRVRGTGGVARVPAGRYHLVRCQFVLDDKAGRRWSFTGGGGENDVPVDVPADSTTPLALGPPLTPKVTLTRIDAERVALNLAMKGAGGETYNEIYYADQIKPPVPKVRLFDLGGRELTQLDFHYG
jgi:hypothetical protein